MTPLNSGAVGNLSPRSQEGLAVGGVPPAAESGGGSLSSASEVVMFAPPAAREEVVYDSGPLGHSLVVLAQTMDDENPAVEEQRRREEEEVKISSTIVEVPEGGETQLWLRNLGETARWDRLDASGAVIQSVPASAEDVDPPPFEIGRASCRERV